MQTSRADLLGETLNGSLVHLELQSKNDDEMALRMVEYALRIYREFGKFPKQIVLYAGRAKMNMPASWRETDHTDPDFTFRYTLVDMRELDSEPLLASPQIEDNLLAILTRLRDRRAGIRQILNRIGSLNEPRRRVVFAQFLVISGLRRLAPAIKEEAQKMPILDDIMDHQVIGPAIRQGLKQGRQQGRHDMLSALIKKRFGTIPAWVEERLTSLSIAELDAVALRLLDAATPEDLFPQKGRKKN